MGQVLFFSVHPKVSACKTGSEEMEGLHGREKGDYCIYLDQAN